MCRAGSAVGHGASLNQPLIYSFVQFLPTRQLNIMINSKTLKLFRSAVRTAGAHLRVRLLISKFEYRMVPDYAAGLNLDGTLKMKPFEFPMPARNAPDTQRTVYRRMKKNRAYAMRTVKSTYAR